MFVARGRGRGPTAAVTAGIHGDEYEGVAAVGELANALDPSAHRGTLILVPVAKPTAFAAGTRTNPEDGVNLARSFPGNPDGTPTERLAAKLFALVGSADTLIDLHSGGVEYRFVPLAGYYGASSDGNPSFAAARHFGLAARWQLPPTPGLLSYELHRRGACAIGCEYLGAGQLSVEGRAAYRDGILCTLPHRGHLPAGPPTAASGWTYTGDWLLAEADGLFHPRFEIGDAVTAGTEVATVTTPRGVVQRLVAPFGGPYSRCARRSASEVGTGAYWSATRWRSWRGCVSPLSCL